MAFLTTNDYYQVIKDDILTQVIETETVSRNVAENAAIAQAASYLSSRYDTTAIFNSTGDNRNEFIVMLIIDIALYHLHARIDEILMPEIRKIRYKEAIEWLNGVANRTINPVGLPALTNNDGSEEMLNRYGSDPSFISKW